MAFAFRTLASSKFRFRSDEGHVCSVGFQIADVERPLESGVTFGGSWKPSNTTWW